MKLLMTHLMVWMTLGNSLFTQVDQRTLLRSKTVAELRDIAGRAHGVVGLAVVDLTSGDRFGLNDTLVFPQASAIKIAVLMEVYKQAGEGKIKLTDQLPLNGVPRVEGGVVYSFGETTSCLSIHDVCILMIVLSDNTATNLLINLVGMRNVNSTLDTGGFSHTRMQRIMMDIAASARGEENTSTPAEAARIMELLATGRFVSRATSEKIIDVLKIPKQGNIKGALPDTVAVAFKQGEIAPGILTEWAFVDLKERPYIFVIMQNFGLDESTGGVFRELSRTLFNYFWRLGKATRFGVYTDPGLFK